MLSLLVLGMHGKGQATHQVWLPLALSLGKGQQKALGTQRSTSACGFLLVLVTEIDSGDSELLEVGSHSMSHEVEVSVGHQKSTDSNRHQC